MIGGKLIRRTIADSLMWPMAIVKSDPLFGSLEKLPQRSVLGAFGNSELERPNESLGVPIVGWSPGSDGDGRSIRYLEWTYDPDETDTTIVTDYVFLLRDGEQPVRVEHDQHITGLFSREQWLSILNDTGFRVSFVIDPFDRHVFVAWKESSSGMCKSQQ